MFATVGIATLCSGLRLDTFSARRQGRVSGLSLQEDTTVAPDAMHVTRILLPVMLKITTAALSLYGAVSFAVWTWTP